MPYDVAPGFVRFEYTSSHGLHVAIIPTREWQQGSSQFGEFTNWNGAIRDAADMISDMADALAGVMHTSATITRATIFTKSVGQPPAPVASVALEKAGTEASPSWRAAVQYTLTARDTAFKLAKLVVLDAPSGNEFSRYTTLIALPAWQTIFSEFRNAQNAWSSRFGARPATLVSLTKTLNEKLRRAYRLA